MKLRITNGEILMKAVSMATAEKELRDYIKEKGGLTSTWYCGITNNLHRRLTRHKVNTEGKYYFVKCTSKNCAELIEKKMQDIRGCAGNPGGGRDNSVFVYVYKRTRTTYDH